MTYLFQYLQFVDFGQFDNGGLPSLNIKKMKEQIVPVPPLSEQQRIVAYLDALSAKIKSLQSNYDQTITLCNDLKQALLKKMFG